MKAKIKISHTVLLAINTFRSTDDVRPAIAGICIEVTKSGKCRAIATDGKRLGAIESGEALEAPEKLESVTFILNEPLLKALPKSKGIGDDVIINVDGARIEFSAYGTSDKTKFEVEASEHKFPNWRQVVPTGDQPLPVDPCFNWRLLDGFTKAASILQRDRSAGIQIRQKNDGAMLVLIPTVPSFVGVLMPIKFYEVSKAPDWISTEEN